MSKQPKTHKRKASETCQTDARESKTRRKDEEQAEEGMNESVLLFDEPPPRNLEDILEQSTQDKDHEKRKWLMPSTSFQPGR
jgi:hypothetical protein